MSPKTKLSLLEIEQEVEAQAREWHRQQLQKRLDRCSYGRSIMWHRGP
jgi:hypothetical protein